MEPHHRIKTKLCLRLINSGRAVLMKAMMKKHYVWREVIAQSQIKQYLDKAAFTKASVCR